MSCDMIGSVWKEVRGYKSYPFCLGWNGDTVEGVSLSSDIVGTVIISDIARLRRREGESEQAECV